MKKDAALVLSGGGARGIAHIGVIEELIENGYNISSIAGTSMGALVGGMYALGKLDEFKKWICELDKIQVFRLVDFTLSNKGLIKGEKVLKRIREFIPDKNIEDLDIPFAAVAADILHHDEIVFTKGSIYEAIRASISIPTVFTPIKSENRLLVDGGVMNNIPVNRVSRKEGDELIVVNVNASIPKRKLTGTKDEQDERERVYLKKLHQFQDQLSKLFPKQNNDSLGYFDILSKTINTMIYTATSHLLEKYDTDMIIEISRDSCNTFDFYKAEELVETGRLQAREMLRKQFVTE